MIYLDHAATSPMSREVIEAMWPYLTGDFGNASSHHELGNRAATALEESRERVARVLACNASEIIFTSGGTESNNLALKGAALANPRGRRIVTTSIEHEAVLEPLSYLRRFHDFKIEMVRVDSEGFVDLDHLRRLLVPETTLCSIQYANSEIGTVQAIGPVLQLCREAGVPMHTDAVQAAGLLTLDVGADMLSMSAHKFGGPKGVGALYCRNTMPLEPVIHGGGQERGARSGTSNVAGAVGLAAALELAEERRDSLVKEMIARRDELIAQVLGRLSTARLTGPPNSRLANCASFTLGNVSGESVVVELAVRDIACSSGSACAEGEDEPSHVLKAIGLDDATAQTAIRFTLGHETTDADIAATAEALVATVANLS